MKVTCEPTEEVTVLNVNGTNVPFRIWSGKTDTGTAVELYVLSIMPDGDLAAATLRKELPSYMVPSRTVMTVKSAQPAD